MGVHDARLASCGMQEIVGRIILLILVVVLSLAVGVSAHISQSDLFDFQLCASTASDDGTEYCARVELLDDCNIVRVSASFSRASLASRLSPSLSSSLSHSSLSHTRPASLSLNLNAHSHMPSLCVIRCQPFAQQRVDVARDAQDYFTSFIDPTHTREGCGRSGACFHCVQLDRIQHTDGGELNACLSMVSYDCIPAEAPLDLGCITIPDPQPQCGAYLFYLQSPSLPLSHCDASNFLNAKQLSISEFIYFVLD